MQLQLADYNGADVLCAGPFAKEWKEIETALTAMPLHVKDSDQAGKQGNLIFDPKGTNAHIHDLLKASGWTPGPAIPDAWSMFGTDVDFMKNGVLVEVQFSNYPFLLNNVMRSQMFASARVQVGGVVPQVLVVITKARMFEASNSTLYFEQGQAQLGALVAQTLFSFPVRLVGLTAPLGNSTATYSTYSAARYSRTMSTRVVINCCIANGSRAGSRATVTRL